MNLDKKYKTSTLSLLLISKVKRIKTDKYKPNEMPTPHFENSISH